MLFPKRIWRDIEGFEGLYQVSNDGKVRSLDRVDSLGHKRKRQIMKQRTTATGYKRVGLYKNGKRKVFLVHRLVAMVFISNPNNYPFVNHKDENPSNNHVSNLEWCTAAYNNSYGTRLERIAKKNTGKKRTEEAKEKISKANKGKKFTEEHKKKIRENHADFAGAKNPQARKVMCLNNGMIFDTVTEAANWSSSTRSSIAKQIQGKIKSTGKDPVTGQPLKWQYIEIKGEKENGK